MAKSFKSIFDRHLPRMSMRRNLATLVSGSAIAQCILLLGLPVLSRCYDPSHFAGLAVITTLGSLVGMAGTLRYDMAIVLPDKQSDAIILAIVAGAAMLAVTIVCQIIVLMFHSNLAKHLGLEDSPYLLYLLPPVILAISGYSIFENWTLRNKGFSSISTAQFGKAGTAILIPLALLIFFKADSTGLIVGHMLGFAVAMSILAFNSEGNYRHRLFKGVERKRIRQMINAYRKFPLFTLPQSFINNLSRVLPNLLLASLYSPKVLGLFFLGYRAFSGPMGILTQSMGKVFYQRASQTYKENRPILPIVLKLYRYFFILIVPPSILLFVFAEPAFRLVFGQEWSEAGRYLKYLLPWLCGMFVVSPSMHILNILNKQEFFLYYDIILLGLRYGILIGGARWFKDPVYTLGLYSLIGFLGYIIIAYVILLLSAKADRQMTLSGEQNIECAK